MKPQDKTRELIQDMVFQPGQDMHDRMISRIRTARAQQPSRQRHFKSYAVTAAAAVILILVSFVLKTPRRPSGPATALTLAPTDLLSMRSMQLAFHNDGLDGLEAYLDASLSQVGPRPTEPLMQGLYDNVDL